MTLSKLRRAKTILNRGEYYEKAMGQRPIILVEEDDVQYLATDPTIQNRENDNTLALAQQGLENDGVANWGGFTIVKVNHARLPAAVKGANTQNRFMLPIFYPQSICYKEQPLVGQGGPQGVRIGERPDLSYANQAYIRYRHSTMRKEDIAVAVIEVERP